LAAILGLCSHEMHFDAPGPLWKSVISIESLCLMIPLLAIVSASVLLWLSGRGTAVFQPGGCGFVLGAFVIVALFVAEYITYRTNVRLHPNQPAYWTSWWKMQTAARFLGPVVAAIVFTWLLIAGERIGRRA
jgi:hypothetical protein